MSYIDDARRALAAALPPALAEAGMEWDPNADPVLFDLYTLLVLTHGEDTTLRQVHDAWSIACHRNRPEHASLVPFGQLTDVVQAYDRPFREAIRGAARAITVGVA